MIKELNIPNKITVARIVLIFIFLALANVGEQSLIDLSGSGNYACYVAAYVLAIIAGITDFLDGYLARKYNVVTDFGKLMDPLADKIFVTATFIMMVEKGFIPAWMAVVVITREFLVTGLRLLASNKGEVMSADKWGKLKTFLQMLMLFIGGASWIKLIPNVRISKSLWHTSWLVLLWAIIIITIYSGVSYFYRYRHLYLDET